MIEINAEWIIGVVFGVGVLYALCQIFMGCCDSQQIQNPGKGEEQPGSEHWGEKEEE